MPITPYLQTPFTDLTGSLINHQTYDKCGEMEMNMMDCLEAYGADRGKKMCKDLIDDYNECFTMHKQMARFHAMRKERMRQGTFADPPRVDAY
ncbi:NADH dehydrogenase [ubiquinone] iron-sulfur protein 5 [Musca domestica]|uniref:NADH dehydrogenase [ubiquinone] iron-sulfur protein 5 n=1 Tax=Musca domestica TaxID=7370 RepID=A0A1I8N3D0_MUSDO|nr:NADH dehydrogenase [ubiquinone] iron-sulfur protein 5 [Musca domestica]